jgi:ABC-2 type transport system permease protein
LTGSGAEDLVDVSQVRVIAENPAVRALYGRPIEVASPGSFIVWRYGQLVTMFAAVWMLLVTTRMLRGEEEAGRWDLVLSARLGRRRLTLLVLGVLLAASATVAAACASRSSQFARTLARARPSASRAESLCTTQVWSSLGIRTS